MDRKNLKRSKLLRKSNPYLLSSIAILVIVIFKIYPLVLNVWYSLIDYKLSTTNHSFVGLKNYISILNDKRFMSSISRTFIWTIANIIGMMLIGIPTAFLLNVDFKGNTLLKSIILIPWILPEIVTGYTWKWMLMGDFGIVNFVLSKIGILSLDYSWFRNGDSAMFAVVLANVWRSIPFVAVMVYAKLKTVPQEIIEAARIDGASKVQLTRHIVFPFITPVLRRVLTLAFIWTFNAFSIIASMTNGGPLYKTEIMALIVQKTAFTKFQFSQASAMSITMSVLLLLVLWLASIVKYSLSKQGGAVE